MLLLPCLAKFSCWFASPLRRLEAMGEKNSPPAAIAVVQAVADAHEGCLAELLSRQVLFHVRQL
eukprot:1086871-Amphidinium_carterae.1